MISHNRSSMLIAMDVFMRKRFILSMIKMNMKLCQVGALVLVLALAKFEFLQIKKPLLKLERFLYAKGNI